MSCLISLVYQYRAMELGRRSHESAHKVHDKINDSASVFAIMHPILGHLKHEEFWVLYLNNSNKVLAKTHLSKGGMTGTIVDVRLVLKQALEQSATCLVLAHNHPSSCTIELFKDFYVSPGCC